MTPGPFGSTIDFMTSSLLRIHVTNVMPLICSAAHKPALKIKPHSCQWHPTKAAFLPRHYTSHTHSEQPNNFIELMKLSFFFFMEIKAILITGNTHTHTLCLVSSHCPPEPPVRPQRCSLTEFSGHPHFE